MKLPPYLFWVPQFKKTLWDPFWWLVLFLIILWVPFLRIWWWLFLPIMLQAQLKTLYLWFINWDFYIANRKWVLLEIIPPKEILMPFKAMEDIFSSIWGIWDGPNFREQWCEGEIENGPEWCSWEIASIEGKVHFYIRVSDNHRHTFESVLFGHYPDIEIREAVDYTKLVPQTVPNEEWDAYGEDWELEKENCYPIKTYEKFFEPQGEKIAAEEKRLDPIIGLLEGMSKLGPGEHYWVQFISVPIIDQNEPGYKEEGIKTINKLSKRPEEKKITLLEDLLYIIRQVIVGPEKEGESYSWPEYSTDADTGDREMVLTPGEREVITEIENKLKKPAFRTNIRGFYVAKREAWNGSHKVISRSYTSHFRSENMNYLKFVSEARPKIHFFWRERRTFLRARKMFRNSVLRYPPLFPERSKGCSIFSPEELATLYHFPLRISGMVSPTLEKVDSKKSGPPSNLPVE